MTCDYRTILIFLLLIALIYLIKTDGNCIVTLGVAILLVGILGNYIKREKFKVNEQTIMIDNKEPIVMTQMQQESKLSNLENNISFVKNMLQGSLTDAADDIITKIPIENSCIQDMDHNNPVNHSPSGNGTLLGGNVPNSNNMPMV
jgi:hypothetical protein